MKIVEAGGARIPAIGLGTYKLEDQAASEVVAQAIGIGYRHIDTARMYGNEREVGKGIRASGVPRNEIFVTTKVWWTDIGVGDLQASAEKAVEAIGIGTVDLLLIHWPNPGIALDDSIEALNDTVSRGLTRHIGVANFTAAMVDDAAAISERPLVCNQVEYHPFLSQDAVLDACRRHDMALVAYAPLARAEAIMHDETILAVAARHGRTPAQVALRWEIQQDGVAAIPKSGSPERLRENLAAFDFELAPDEMEQLAGLSKRRSRLIDPAFAPNWDRV